MTKSLSKKISLSVLFIMMLLAFVPITMAQAVECDADGDGYISFPSDGADVILGAGVEIDGNYTAAEWANFYETFKNDPSASSLCNALNFKKGAEPTRCDSSLISANSGVYDPSQASSVPGSTVYPNAFDKPNNGIDENCDGADGMLIDTSNGSGNLASLGDKVIYFLSRAVVVVSVIILIWGGMMYSTAAGDERKTAKARKAIVGAIIGLIVGLLAPSVVSFIIASLG